MKLVDKQKEEDVQNQLCTLEEIGDPVISWAVVWLKFVESWNMLVTRYNNKIKGNAHQRR